MQSACRQTNDARATLELAICATKFRETPPLHRTRAAINSAELAWAACESRAPSSGPFVGMRRAPNSKRKVCAILVRCVQPSTNPCSGLLAWRGLRGLHRQPRAGRRTEQGVNVGHPLAETCARWGYIDASYISALNSLPSKQSASKLLVLQQPCSRGCTNPEPSAEPRGLADGYLLFGLASTRLELWFWFGNNTRTPACLLLHMPSAPHQPRQYAHLPRALNRPTTQRGRITLPNCQRVEMHTVT